jgi:hypothetical protein
MTQNLTGKKMPAGFDVAKKIEEVQTRDAKFKETVK